MSRCFPFPPPGYEKKPKSVEHEDLLAKELKEKKHKKKRDKEKRESKKRKGKDSSKDKHKEKKERKVKHRDGNNDKDKSRISEDQRTVRPTEFPHEVRPKHDSQKVERIKDSKFSEELGRRIRDEERGAANQMGEVLTVTTQRVTNTIVSLTAMPNENIRSDKMVNDIIGTVVNDIIGTVQRRNENVYHSVQKSAEDTGTAAALEKQRASNVKSRTSFLQREKEMGVSSLQFIKELRLGVTRQLLKSKELRVTKRSAGLALQRKEEIMLQLDQLTTLRLRFGKELRTRGLQLHRRSKETSFLQREKEMRLSYLQFRKELTLLITQLLWKGRELQVMRRLAHSTLQSKEEILLRVDPVTTLQVQFIEQRANSLPIQWKRKGLWCQMLFEHRQKGSMQQPTARECPLFGPNKNCMHGCCSDNREAKSYSS